MDLAFAVALVTATANLMWAALHAALARAPGWRTSRLLAVLAATAGLYNITGAVLCTGGFSEATYLLVGRAAYFLGHLHCISWVVYAYSEQGALWSGMPRLARRVVAGSLAIAVVFALTGWGVRLPVESVVVVWAGVEYHFPQTTWAGEAYGLLFPVLLGLAIWRMAQRFRKGERFLGFQMAAFAVFLATTVEEMLVANRAITFLTLSDIGFVVVLLPVSIQTVRLVIAAARRLEELTGRLREEVAERTAALLESEQRYRLLVETSPDGIVLSDLGGRIVMANRRAAALLGYAAADALVGLSSERLAWARADGLAEIEVARLDGSTFPAEVSTVLVHDAEGRVTGAMRLLRDLTERRAADRERASLEEQLRQAQKLESIGRLAGGVAHDFNNLLTVINGYSQLLLQRAPVDSELRPSLEVVLHAGERAAALTRQLLAFSRKQTVELRCVDLVGVVRQSQEMLARLLGEDVQLSVEAGPEPAWVSADPGQLSQVLMNLAANARDAMPRGGRLSIRVEVVEDGEFVVLHVSDNGMGMTAETRRRLFEPFFTTKGEGKGTGLGLSTVYGIVLQSGGSITVESEPGCGAAFTIRLPASAAPEQDEATAEAAGFRVVEAASGEEALALPAASLAEVDLLLTDVIMPGMTGGDLAERLTRLRPGLKVLFFSGYTDDVIAPHGVLAPGVEFVHKPFAPSDLTARVSALIGGR